MEVPTLVSELRSLASNTDVTVGLVVGTRVNPSGSSMNSESFLRDFCPACPFSWGAQFPCCKGGTNKTAATKTSAVTATWSESKHVRFLITLAALLANNSSTANDTVSNSNTTTAAVHTFIVTGVMCRRCLPSLQPTAKLGPNSKLVMTQQPHRCSYDIQATMYERGAEGP